MFKGLKDIRVWGLAVVAVVSFLLPASAKAAVAAPVKLAWNASTDPDVRGYAVYYGPASAPDANRMDVGANLQAVIPALTANAAYSFQVVAYNADQAESEPSNLIQHVPPVLTRITLDPEKVGALTVMKVQFRGPVGASCRVQYTDSLTTPDWKNIAGSYVAAADGTVTVTDSTTASSKTRFYRAVYP